MFSTNTQQRAYNFVRIVAGNCSNCLHGHQMSECESCQSKMANSILLDMSAEMRQVTKVIDYSLAARVLKILSSLIRAQQPLLSKSIKLDHICSNQLKQWTLKSMIHSGLIRRKFAFKSEDKKIYQYSITNKGRKYYENHKSGTC